LFKTPDIKKAIPIALGITNLNKIL